MEDHLRYVRLGGTLDDASGEAFDKVGRLLGLAYPGGPEIEKIARNGNPKAFKFPRARLGNSLDFSFSGLKTSVLRETQKYDEDRLPVNDLAASFQSAVIDVLVEKTAAAAVQYEVSAVHLVGGVSANRSLRQEMQERLEIPVRNPPTILCTDNAAMIAAAAHWHFISGRRDSLDLDVFPSLRL
jgi:N6-L-threonylcarbamoyladenine synthase